MTGRERFRRYMHYQPADRAPNIEVGAWTQTVQRWLGEGLPPGTGLEEFSLTFNGNDFFGLDRQRDLGLNAGGPLPSFEPEVLQEDDRVIVQRDHLAPPDTPYRNWLYYLDCKRKLLAGETRL